MNSFALKLLLLVVLAALLAWASYAVISNSNRSSGGLAPPRGPSGTLTGTMSGTAINGSAENTGLKTRGTSAQKPQPEEKKEITEKSENVDLAKKPEYKIPEHATVSRFDVSGEEVGKYVDFSLLYDEISKSDARFVERDGIPVMTVTKVAENSLIERLGFKKDDHVRFINGISISNPMQIAAVYVQLKDESEFTVEFERSGEVLVYIFKISD